MKKKEILRMDWFFLKGDSCEEYYNNKAKHVGHGIYRVPRPLLERHEAILKKWLLQEGLILLYENWFNSYVTAVSEIVTIKAVVKNEKNN